jgi:hypothetical protein
MARDERRVARLLASADAKTSDPTFIAKVLRDVRLTEVCKRLPHHLLAGLEYVSLSGDDDVLRVILAVVKDDPLLRYALVTSLMTVEGREAVREAIMLEEYHREHPEDEKDD